MTTHDPVGRRGSVAPVGLLDSPVPLPLTVPGDSHARHLARLGPLPADRGPGQLLEWIGAAGLTGCGGAGFPVADKWRSIPAGGPAVVVVGNGAESEPLSAKDAVLLALRPHLVLDGLVLTARAVGAREAVLWVHGDPGTGDRLIAALAERGEGDGVRLRVVTAPGRYLSGESSAVVHGLGTGDVRPVFAIRPATAGGVDGRPTLVHNVETLARVAMIARHGPDGCPDGTLVTVTSGATRTVCELAPGTTVADALRAAGAAADGESAPQAVLVGGYAGTWAPWSRVATATLAELDGGRSGPDRPARPRLATGVLAGLATTSCGLAHTAAIARYFAAESAGQCGPCVFGTREVARVMSALAAGSARGQDVERLLPVLGLVEGRGACALPDGLAELVRSALRVFQRDVKQHVRGGRCLTGPRPGLQPELLPPGTSGVADPGPRRKGYARRT